MIYMPMIPEAAAAMLPGLVTRAEIEEELYGFEDEIASNAIEVHIHNLRRKLGPRFITNLKGRGYRVDNDR